MPLSFPLFLFKNRPALVAALVFALLLPGVAHAGESLPERTLAGIVDREKRILADAAKSGEGIDAESFRVQVQGLCSEYEILLRENPNFAAGYACYGYLLSKMDMPRQAIGILLKANQLDPNIPLVKNQIGNFLAEQGKPIEAENYYMAAIKLDPDEPLYHYQLGQLLYVARDDFLKSGYWTADQIDDSMHKAFARAAALAPNRIEFTYRYAESFNDLKRPDWDKALKVWAGLEDRETSDAGRQIIRLQAANVLIKEGKYDAARVLIATVTEPKLGPQKQKLVAELPENAKH
jgi:tetratricopeptide (TPR) repeat protein